MYTTPEFVVSQITGTLKVEYDGTEYTLTLGTNKIPSILVNGNEDVELTFTGNATVEVVYRGGSL
jgi:hypothetical protein